MSTSNQLAIVSPCSTCKNQQYTTTKPGLPVCPRRAYQKKVQALTASGGNVEQIKHLALYGTEGTPQEGDGTLRNPVYSDDLHSILVWIAPLRDNMGMVDDHGTILTPSILEPNFDTTYITCKLNPVVPKDQEATYFQKGAFSEGDQIEVSLTSGQQVSSKDAGVSVPVGGFGQKVSFIFNHPRKPLTKDVAPAGC